MTTVAPPSDVAINAALGLSMRVGELALASGVPSADAANAISTVAVACGMPRQQVAVDVTMNSLLVSITSDEESPPFSRVHVVAQRRLDYTRLTRLYRMIDALVDGRLRPEAASDALTGITDAPPPYPLRVSELATAGLAGAVVVLIGGNLWGVLVAVVTTFATLWLIDAVERRGLPRFFGNVAAGAMVTAVAVVLVSAGLPVRPSFIVAGGIIALLPAVDILAAVSDALSGYPVTAAGRFIDVFFLSSGIAAGVVFVLNIAVRFDVNIRLFAVEESTAPPLLRLVAGAVASALFLLGASGPWRLMPYAGMVGGLGLLLGVGLGRLDVVGVTSVAASAVVIGTMAVVTGRALKVPALVLAVPGFIPLLPGLALYDGMFQISRGNTAIGLIVLVGAISSAVALASGVVLGDAISGRLRQWRRLIRDQPWRKRTR